MCYISALVHAAVELVLLVVDCKVLHCDAAKYVYSSQTKVSEYFLIKYSYMVLEAGELCPFVIMFICTSQAFFMLLSSLLFSVDDTHYLLVVLLSCIPYAVPCV